jgi:GNAT superfamily N-acetyltransferase
MSNQEIKIATKEDIEKLIPVFRELRPHRNERQLQQLLSAAFLEGYRVAYIGNGELAFSILGFRIITFIFSGKTLKIDDLATLASHRNNGYAGKLFEWIKHYAKKDSCDHLNLDSGFHRHDAYKFYLNQGLHVESLHFGRKVVDL